jgi:signal peptidase I
MPPVTVKPGQFFLVSDNRQFPLDSRDFGPVDASTCTETIVFRLWGPGGYFNPNRRFDLIR